VPGIFISYRRDDALAWAIVLRDRLVRTFGPRSVFLDVNSLDGVTWRPDIAQAVEAARAVLVVIGPGWLTATDAAGQRRLTLVSDVHRAEITTALHNPRTSVVPVLVGGARLPRPDDLPADLQPLLERQARELGAAGDRREAELDAIERLLFDVTGQRRYERLARLSLAAALVIALLNAILRFDSMVAAVAFLSFATAAFGLSSSIYIVMRRERLKGWWPSAAAIGLTAALIAGSLLRLRWLGASS